MKILVIEDNLDLLSSISLTLMGESFLCEMVENYTKAHEKIHLYEYDLLIVDINLPDGSGLNLIREIKRVNPQTGIIVVSARNSIDNKVEGLELGADDYITKPFDMAELVARVKSLVRRRNFAGTTTITMGSITINTSSRMAEVNGKALELTKSEFDILLFFFSNPSRVISRESIAEHIWGDNMDLADSFDFIYSHIKNLRKKITQMDVHDPIKAVYGVGYKFEPEE
ncbi:MAG: response regulator transcription factor [Tenuifilaceae bacterium]|jgi:DNA-binding response OmpR family regulator|nr:response regulator transcription factor [Tenuifilaceae bacterium]